jgi:DNA-binding CsgD family transcriptional regulator
MALSNDLNIASMPDAIRREIPPFVWSGASYAAHFIHSERAVKRLQFPMATTEPKRWQRATADARLALEQAASAAAEAAERAMSVAEVLDQALAVLAEATSSGQRPLGDGSPLAEDVLSPRECEVLSLIAEGRSNKAIAEALFVSPNTIKTHVASILHKMEADSRVQLAAMAARHEGAAYVRGSRTAAAR